jgi:D-amino-acid dehydrogenase
MKVAVVGAGIVGLACAYHLLRDGHAVTLIDRDPQGDRTSFGNAGGIAVTEIFPAARPGLWRKIPGWLIDPLGPLSLRPAHVAHLIPWLRAFLRAGNEVPRITEAIASLNVRVVDDLLPMLEAAGLAGELRRNGALLLYETDAGFAADMADAAALRAHGWQCDDLGSDDIRTLEPDISPAIRLARFVPAWCAVSDPRRIWRGMFHYVAQQATIIAGDAARVGDGVLMSDAQRVAADEVVVAAGAWSAALARTVGDRVLLESERGYNTTLPDPGVRVNHSLTFAERHFVAAPLAIGLRIGGAAEFAGLAAAPNWQRSEALLTLARRYLPGLDTTGGTSWMGHRPSTPDSLPVIGRSSRDPRVVYAFGHGHLGLTQSATTGRIVADIIGERDARLDLTPYRASRFG